MKNMEITVNNFAKQLLKENYSEATEIYIRLYKYFKIPLEKSIKYFQASDKISNCLMDLEEFKIYNQLKI